jgi:acetyltransferase-like isoleucine patch superfamily enzyme
MKLKKIKKVVRAIARNPRVFFSELFPMIIRGVGIRIRFWANPRVRLGPDLLVQGEFHIFGPGRVTFKRGVQCLTNSFSGVKIVTQTSSAHVLVGEEAMLGGVTIVCTERVEIGRGAILANSYLTDKDFPLDEAEKPVPVKIGEDCWISGGCGVLKGTDLGNGSVLGVGAVCRQGRYPAGFVLLGNPARPIMKIGE